MPTSIDLQWFTPVFTIFGGIFIFIVSQAVLKLVIEPVQQFKGAIGLTANTLLRHHDTISNGTGNEDVSSTLKGHAAELVSKAEMILWYRPAKAVFRLPSRADVIKVAQELNVISYGTRNKRPTAYPEIQQSGDALSRHNNISIVMKTCYPANGTTSIQKVRTIVNYLQEHSDLFHIPAAALTLISCMGAFRCERWPRPFLHEKPSPPQNFQPRLL